MTSRGSSSTLSTVRYVNQLADAIRRYREEHKVNCEEFGRIAGIKARETHALEIGDSWPSVKTLQTLAGFFGWTAEEVGALALSLPLERQMYYVPPEDRDPKDKGWPPRWRI